MVYSLSLTQDSHITNQNMNHLFLLTTMFPLDFFCITELWFLYVKYSLENKLKMDNSFAVINSPNLIPNLAHIDYAIFDKTGTITTQNRNLSLLYFKEIGDIFEFDDFSHFLENFYKASHNNNNTCVKNIVIEEERKNFMLKEPNFVNSKKLIEDFHSSEGINGFHDLLEAFMICNTLKIEYSKDKKMRKMKFRTIDEKFLLSFAQYLDYEFIDFYKKENRMFHTIRIRKNIYDYQILGLHESEQESAYNLFTILYHDPRKNNYIIACKGHSSNLIKKLKLSKEELEILDSIMMIFYKKGFIDPLMYAKRMITEKEADSFFDKYKNLQSSLINQNDSLRELMSELSFDLELVGIVGIEEQLEPGVFELISFLKSLSINTWLLTGDSKQNAYNVANRIGIFDEKAEQYCLESENYDDLVKNLKKILISFNNDLKPISISPENKKRNSKLSIYHSPSNIRTKLLTTVVHENYDKYIFINGKSFDIITKDEYLFSNFLFTCSLIRTIIGFNFSAMNKKKFVEIIKQRLGKKKSTVMAIGDGYNDIMMLNSADVGIEIIKNNNNQKIIKKNMMIGDLILSNLKQVKVIMKNYAGIYFDRYHRFLQLSYYRSFIYGFSLFVYAYFDSFNSNCLYDPILTLFYYGVFTAASQTLCLLFYEKIPDQIRNEFVEIYHEGKYQKKNKKIIKTLFLLILEGFMISLVITVIDLFIVKNLLDANGFTGNYNSLGIILGYSFSVLIQIKVNI